jgi:hypothetical protein
MRENVQFDLYAMVFDAPILNRRALISTLEIWGCKNIEQGPTEYSIEFSLDTREWPKDRWQNWNILINSIHNGYRFNKERSVLPSIR